MQNFKGELDGMAKSREAVGIIAKIKLKGFLANSLTTAVFIPTLPLVLWYVMIFT